MAVCWFGDNPQSTNQGRADEVGFHPINQDNSVHPGGVGEIVRRRIKWKCPSGPPDLLTGVAFYWAVGNNVPRITVV